MAKQNWHNRVVVYMLAHNYKPLNFRGSKYERFGLTIQGENYRTYLVGSNGAVRREITWTDSNGKEHKQTTSVTEMFHQYVEKWERENDRALLRGIYRPYEN